MSKEDFFESAGIDKNLLNRLAEYNKKLTSGEQVDPEVRKAIEAINIAGKVMNSINSGIQVDPTYFKSLASEFGSIVIQAAPKESKKIKKKKKLSIKNR